MADDHEDYETGAAPAAHGPSHEKDGDDEVSVAGLSGEGAALAAHKILPSIHHIKYTDVEAAAAAAALILIHKGDAVAHQNAPQLILDHKGDAVAHQDAPALIETHRLVADAHHGRYTDGEAQDVADARILTHKGDAVAHQDAPALIETHRLVADAHHGRYTDGEAQDVADARILTHKGDAVAHQDAPQLILDHKGDASAHHAKYTDAEARAVHSPISIPPASFMPRFDTHDWQIQDLFLKNRTSTSLLRFYAPVLFPQGVTITKLTLYGYRSEADSGLGLFLYRNDRAGGLAGLAVIGAGWTDGYGSVEDTTIDNPIVNNASYSYNLYLQINPHLSVDDCFFTGAKIEFTG